MMLLDASWKMTKFQFDAEIEATNSIPWVMHSKTTKTSTGILQSLSYSHRLKQSIKHASCILPKQNESCLNFLNMEA